MSADEALLHPWIANAKESMCSPRKHNIKSKENELLEEIRVMMKSIPRQQVVDKHKMHKIVEKRNVSKESNDRSGLETVINCYKKDTNIKVDRKTPVMKANAADDKSK